MHLQFVHKYTRISPKIGYSMSEKKNQPQNMTYFSMKIVRNYGARFFTRSIDTQVFFDTHPAYRWNKDGSKFQGKLI